MRTWIASRHFPDELRITILEEPNSEAIALLDDDNVAILPNLIENLAACDWVVSSIQSSISDAAKSLDMSPRHAYRALYLCIMGTERGPRLPTILTELEQSSIVNLLNACLESKKES